MKNLIKIMFMLMLGAQNSFAIDTGRVITAKVNGMVCAFCSNSLKKKFSKKKEVQSIKIDLDTKLITLSLKKNKNLSEKTIRKIIKTSGFSVVSIDMNNLIKDRNEK